MPAASNDFSTLGTSESPFRSIDFADGLAAGETIQSAACTISVLEGTDADAADRVISGPSISGSIITVQLGTMLDAVTYRVLITVTTSLGQVLSAFCQQPCAAP
jgi:hypothetical protein